MYFLGETSGLGARPVRRAFVAQFSHTSPCHEPAWLVGRVTKAQRNHEVSNISYLSILHNLCYNAVK